jgi:hypothetical protein
MWIMFLTDGQVRGKSSVRAVTVKSTIARPQLGTRSCTQSKNETSTLAITEKKPRSISGSNRLPAAASALRSLGPMKARNEYVSVAPGASSRTGY